MERVFTRGAAIRPVPAFAVVERRHVDAVENELTADDAVTLLPATPRPVRVLIRMANNRLRELIRRALGATRLAEIVNDRPDLLITDRAGEPTAPEQSWIAQFSSPDKGEVAAFSGPFVLDRTNPLTDGLSLKGVVWGTGKDDEITEGNPTVPDVLVTWSRDDVRAGRDPDLEAALTTVAQTRR